MRTDSPFRTLLASVLLLAAAGCGDGPPPWYAVTTQQTASGAIPATVAQGDTLYGIAIRMGVPVRAIIDANDLTPPYRITPGQQLRVPAVNRHVVLSHETLYGISRRYRVDMTTLAALNGIAPPYRVHRGQSLSLPARAEVSTAAAAPAETPDATEPEEESWTTGGVTVSPLPVPETPTRPAPVVPPSTQAFIWPAQGTVLSSYGRKDDGRRNNGINIALPENAPVMAAGEGVVVYAGSGLEGYGNLLLIRHEDGWITAYAHNNELLVSRGDRVERGQVVARVGRTGDVETPQLHFELRRGADAVDPAEFIS